MAFWDDKPVVINGTQKKRVRRIEIIGDIDLDFTFNAYLEVYTVDDQGVEIVSADSGLVTTTFAESKLDPVLGPMMLKIQSNCKSLVRNIKKA